MWSGFVADMTKLGVFFTNTDHLPKKQRNRNAIKRKRKNVAKNAIIVMTP